MPPFDDIGFLLMDIAKMCNVDAARIVTGDAHCRQPVGRADQSGFHVVGSEPFQAPDGTQARLLLLSMKRRRLSERELTCCARWRCTRRCSWSERLPKRENPACPRGPAGFFLACARAGAGDQRASASLRTGATAGAAGWPSTSR